MLKKIKSSTDISEELDYLHAIKEDTLAIVDQFYQVRNAYRFLGMFDSLYGDLYPNEILAVWFTEQVNAMRWGKNRFQGEIPGKVRSEVVILLNAIMSFLEKMAARGDLMAGEQDVSLDVELQLFKRMVHLYMNDLIASSQGS